MQNIGERKRSRLYPEAYRTMRSRKGINVKGHLEIGRNSEEQSSKFPPQNEFEIVVNCASIILNKSVASNDCSCSIFIRGSHRQG